MSLLRRCILSGICTLMILAPALPASAGTDWLKFGKSLLENIGEKSPEGALSIEEIEAGLKEALRVGAGRVVAQLGRVDGYNLDGKVHIPLPRRFEPVVSALEKIGMASLLDDLELKLNRAAEQAAPAARKIFGDAILGMRFEDVKKIYDGPQDAATRYFREKMSQPLAEAFRPVIEKCLAEVGAVRAWETAVGRYRSLPFVPDVKADLTGHVIEKGIDGIFHYMAVEEAAIRKDPAKRTTDLLKKVFGAGATSGHQ